MVNTFAESLHRPSLSNQVAGILRDAILQGKYELGEELKESGLADEFRVGRGTLREALQVLATEGLIEKEPNKTWRIRQITEQMWWEVTVVRAVLEGTAAYLAVQRLTPEGECALTAAIQEMEKTARGQDDEAWNTADFGFHRTLVELSGNQILGQSWTNLAAYSLLMIVKNPMHRETRMQVAAEHRQVLESILSKDPARAEQAVKKQLIESHHRPIFEKMPKPWQSDQPPA
jgi:DNA-binding GntR family transcriptional regulator